MNATKIDLETWHRKSQYDFFKDFDQPFYNVTVPADISLLHQQIKLQKQPFFLSILHQILKAVHAIPEFKYRLEDNEVYEHHQIDAGVTILLEDNSFIFCTIQYEKDSTLFLRNAQASIQAQKEAKEFTPHKQKNIIYVSSLPWLSFTGFQHARKTVLDDSIPRFILGKFYEENGKVLLPLSTEVHHALADGFHLGQFYKEFTTPSKPT